MLPRLPYATAQAIKDLPGVLAFQYLLKGPETQHRLVGPHTRLCLEGFPRSANTFASSWLVQSLQIPDHAFAHHTHTVCNIRRAIRANVPTFVLIREPALCCLSLVVWGATSSLMDALGAYATFYTKLLRLQQQVRIVETEKFIADPLLLAEQVARALGCAHSPILAPEITELVKSRMVEGQRDGVHRIGLPVLEKDLMKEKVWAEQDSPRVRAALQRCSMIRQEVLSCSTI